MDSSDEKKEPVAPQSANGDVEEKPLPGMVGELVDDLTVLGYKPELQRNRSMFTLLFQSLAIAAVSASPWGPFPSRTDQVLISVADTIWLWRPLDQRHLRRR